MRILPKNASDSEIRSLVVEWNELLAKQNYKDALELIPFSTQEYDWTPELLKKVINGYGVADHDDDFLQNMLEEYEVQEFVISSIETIENKESFIENSIDIDRENLFGLNPEEYIGMVHYDDVPLCDFLSDLTARFHIKKINSDTITLGTNGGQANNTFISCNVPLDMIPCRIIQGT